MRKKIITIILSCLLLPLVLSAQQTLRGTVADAADGQPLEAATVQLLRGSGRKLVGYALTDASGHFNMKADLAMDSLLVSVSILGYKTVDHPITSPEEMRFNMEHEAFALREVEIRPGRVWGNRDTINYDVAQFLTAKDATIKDVLRKLPGVDIDEQGKISYNGKDISNFYVEGMDLTDGRYSRMANNLDARSVETVQLLENHQPIRILQDKIKTEDIAMNLKLKPEFRAKWMLTLQAGLGTEPLLWDGWLNAMQLSRRSQSAYIYKGNNHGTDVTDENLLLFRRQAGRMQEPDIPAILAPPSITAPLKKERLLFNDVHSFTANRLTRLGETAQLRINAAYEHDARQQTRGSETTYFQQEDTTRIDEQSQTRLRSDKAELTLNLEDNAPDKYLTNKLKLTGEWSVANTAYTGSRGAVDQRMETPSAGAGNDFKTLWERGALTYEARSTLNYRHAPSELLADSARQWMNLNYLYTDNSFSVLRKNGFWTQEYSAGFTARANNIQSGYSLYASPSWQWNKGKWQTRMAAPAVWTTYPGSDFSRFSANPSLSLSWKYNYAWRYTFSANYREHYAGELNFRTAPYQTDYRNSVQNSGSMPIHRTQNYALYGEYKNTIHEFFATLALSYSHTWNDHIYEQEILDDYITLRSQKMANTAENWSLRGTLSKGFYDLGMKASMDYRLGRSRAEQLSRGERTRTVMDMVQMDPKLSWSPSRRVEAGYEANIRCRRSEIAGAARLPPLWSVVQKLDFSYTQFPVELNISAEHYYNDISKSKSMDAFFADCSARWKFGDWQLSASVTNIFDNRRYSYTEYSAIRSYTSWIDIRGREFLIGLRWRFI